MNEQQNSPIKNLFQNDLINKNRRLILPVNKSQNTHQVSSQFRVCNRKTDQKEEKNIKLKNINFNTNINIFRLNSSSKNSISQEMINKKKKEHDENLKKMKELEKLIEKLNSKNNSLSNEINNLKNEKETLNKNLKEKDDEEKELNEELDNIKNINEEKNREYLHLMQTNQQRNNRNNNRQSNNEQNNIIEQEHQSMNNIFSGILRMQRQVIGENNNEGEEQNNINLEDKSINDSNADIIGDLNEDLGPPMNFNQIDNLPVEKYPKKDVYDEKCILCGFNLYYNDSITKLQQCQHIFHKECLGNFLLHRLASKCPICKVSLI